MGPAGHPGDVSVMRTSTSPSAIATSYTRPKSMMFMSSSGSFTWRKTLRTTSAVSCAGAAMDRSEEHTSELQSQSNLVCRLLLEKKKKNNYRSPGQGAELSRHAFP